MFVSGIDNENKTNNPTLEESMTTDEIRQMCLDSIQDFQEGTVVSGNIISLTGDEAIVDIGYKSEGVIPISEFRDISKFNVGDTINVYLEAFEDQNGMVVLSKKVADKLENWEKTVLACEEGRIIEGHIFKKVKGGFMVDIGMEAFLPASQVDIKPLKDMESFVGMSFEFKVIKIDEARKNIVVSRRILLEERRKKDRDALLQEINVGDVRPGIVKNITDFGAFIDLNGIDGLLHITDITWKRISHPSEVLAIGDSIEVVILDFDKEKERVSLGLKQKTDDPWANIEDKYPVGSKVKGKVVNMMPYGAFLELEEGIEGLIHISELSWSKRISNPAEVLSLNDEVEAMVLNMDKDQRRISLGLKQVTSNPWDTILEKYPVESKITGKIRNIASYGVFVELEDGIDGLIHVSDISWTKKVSNPSDMFKKGDTVDALVLSVDQENKKIALGIKQLSPDPWISIPEKYQIGQTVECVVTNITTFGAFAEIEENVEGLIHISQICDKNITAVTECLNVGDKVEAVIIKVDAEERKLGLSTREYFRAKEIAGEDVGAEAKEEAVAEEAPAAEAVEEAKDEE